MGTGKGRKLRDKLDRALQKARFREALRIYEELQRLEPREPRWPHRKGDLLKRLGHVQDALRAYEAAVHLYAKRGFLARAAAMAKVILSIDPSRLDILERVDPEAARKLYRSGRKPEKAPERTPEEEDEEPTTPSHLLEAAVPLVVVKPNRPDEVRFTQPPSKGGPSKRVTLSQAEVRRYPKDFETSTGVRPNPLELAQLTATPLFTEVEQEVFERLVKESRLVDLEDAERLLEAGTTADALYVLVEGRVELQRPDESDPLILTEGELVGVSCLLNRVNYEANATAIGKVRALRISKLLLDRLVEEQPRLENLLLDILGRRLIANLLRSSAMFSPFDEETRAKTANLFEVRRADPGTALLEAGKRSDGLYIPLLGELIAKWPNGTEMGRVKLGRALGQGTLLRKEASTVTVEAQTEVLVLRMPIDHFEALIAEHPRLVAHLDELAQRPSQTELSILPPPPKSRAEPA